MRLWLHVALLCIYLTKYAIETASIVRDASTEDSQRVRRSEVKDPPIHVDPKQPTNPPALLRKIRSGGDDSPQAYPPKYEELPALTREKRSDGDDSPHVDPIKSEDPPALFREKRSSGGDSSVHIDPFKSESLPDLGKKG
ncbi:uncharacterized protein LOC127730329 [Mytilus californianus]|uniref:uncharacterized protein LOC127730329 n=1 Tax=Mytilus californianus TaxID=6549 RepID=UPI0022480F07|nr:uncharacterized protein LOC127730329 [Mytilus californianus]